MISCNLNRVKRVLCLGAHSDDIEIGCGGTVLQMLEQSKSLEFYWLVLCANPERTMEAKRSASAFLVRARKKTIVVKPFRDGFLPYLGSPVKQCFEELKKVFTPDIIFTHCRRDLHQDHRLVCELTWNTFRDHFILEYEVPKYDADLRSPNLFVSVSDEMCGQKIARLLELFESQRERRWFTEDVFRSVLRLRGMECNSPTRYAEAFYCRKIVATL